MGENKKYYWIKLKTDFFSADSPMDFLLSQENGSQYVCLYIKLCLMTANNNGRLCNQIGEILIPYDVEKITHEMKYFSVDTVVVALELFKKLGLIYQEEDGMLCIADYDDMVGSEGASAARMRKHRASVTLPSHCDIENRDKRIEIRDIEIDKDKEKDNRAKSTRFVPPTLDEVKEYCLERGNQVNAERFIDFYSSKGWMVGKNKMKDWKAAVRTWEQDKKEPKDSKSEWLKMWEDA
ncbi:MAG: phage replisome organizer N-terminal domain-containing protein [Bacteroidales bacterium]|nr:phage replisome organizer N-terminal domain-containing protein [Candidatus Scybalousia scybalohippi]